MSTERDGPLLVRQEGAVAFVRMRRPPVNALSLDLLDALAEAFRRLAAEEAVRAVILTGDGAIFSAGADLAAAAADPSRLLQRGREVLAELAAFPKPLLAAVNGLALGGGLELALVADLRLAVRSARMGQPEIDLGILPGWGGTVRLPRLVGLARARELIFSGRTVGAEEAERIGLVERVYADDELLDQARNLARALAEKPPLAIREAKALLAADDGTISAAFQREAEALSRLLATRDAAEGVSAFLAHRRPHFTGS
jgi:enoyl-CoA hydratase/carnithine racemase